MTSYSQKDSTNFQLSYLMFNLMDKLKKSKFKQEAILHIFSVKGNSQGYG